MDKLAFLLFSFTLFSLSCAKEANRFAQDPNAVFQPPTIIQPPIEWKAGAQMGIAQGKLCVISGIGKLKLYIDNKEITGDVTADGRGGCVYSNVENVTTKSEYVIGNCSWKAGAILGILSNGHAIGIISGTGKLYLSLGTKKEITGDVTADGKGGCIYSNVENDTTKGEYVVGDCGWKAGAILGITSNGHAIGVISGTGKLYLSVGTGKEITGDVTADGRGGCIYSNVENDTTTSDYWDGLKMWKAGAIIGITDKGKRIGVVNGTLTSDNK
jgi:hypothetical protein